MRERRKVTSLLLILLAFILGWAGQRYFAQDHVRDALLVYAGAVLLLVITARRVSRRDPEAGRGRYPALAETGRKITPHNRAPHLKWGYFPLAGSLLAGVIGLILFRREPIPDMAWGFYLGSILVSLIGFALLDDRLNRSNLRAWWTFLDSHRRELILLALILVFGTFMRLYRLDSFPYGTWYDEGIHGVHARRMLEDPSYRPLFVPATNHPAHFLYLLALGFKVLGVSTQSMRVVTVVLGLLTVPAAYWLGRQLFDSEVALVAAAFLAVSRWDVTFSRFAITGVSSPLFELLTLACLMWALRSGSLLAFALGGVALGVGLNLYSAFRLFPIVVGLFLVHKAVTEGVRSFLSWAWPGLVAFGLTTLLAVAPLIQYAVRNPDVFFSRTQQVSIFKDKTPEEARKDLIESTKKHLLMFNYEGDPNGRHNLPGEPMLDFATAALFLLGLGYSVINWRRPDFFLLVVGIAIMLLGGVLSLLFEAPQSLRAIGTLPFAYLLACVPLALAGWEFERTFGERHQSFFSLALLILVSYVGVVNYRTYFQRQVKNFTSWNEYSTPQTLVAEEMKALGPSYRFIVSSLFFNHPAIRFLAPEMTDYEQWTATSSLPLERSGEKGVVLLLDPTKERPIWDMLQQYYPTAVFRQLGPPFGGPAVVNVAELTAQDVASIQGLTGAYYQNAEWEGEPAFVRKEVRLEFGWSKNPPLTFPFSVEWTGTLRVSHYGAYNLGLEAPDEAEVYIDESLVLEGRGGMEKSLTLAKGNHALRIRAVGAEGQLRLYWRPPNRPVEVIPQTALYTNPPVANHGLLGRYYANVNWQGEPAFAQIDPSMDIRFHILPLPRPYSVEWAGKIQIPMTGFYEFATQSIDHSWLYIDDQLVVANDAGVNQYVSGGIHLEEGLHDVRLRYTDETSYTYVKLFWLPPNRPQEIVPSHRLFPPQGAYPATQLAAPRPPPPTLEAGQVRLSFDRVLEETRLEEPRDVAVGPDGTVYVVDTGTRQLLRLKEDGRFLGVVAGGFQAPFAVAVDDQGRVYVLDSGEAPPISLFSPEGELLGRLGTDLGLFSPRGLTLDEQGFLYVADTGRGRVVKLNREGELLTQFSGGGQLRQPTDVSVSLDGYLYVTDPDASQVWVLSPLDQVVDQWAIPRANTYDAPHVTVGPQGAVYVTDPEGAAVMVFDRHGKLLTQVGGRGTGSGQFSKPLGLAVSQAGHLYVTDTYNQRLQRYRIGQEQ
ncbi:MAG: PA14 domain-containing protein [Anaerolineae bacterium]